MFQKKKKEEEVASFNTSYSSWDSDLGFLFLIHERRKAMSKNFIISLYSDQLSDGDYLSDDILTEQIERCVSDTINALSEEYIKFLTTKYFKGLEALSTFLSEDTYNDLLSDAVNKNAEKLRKKIQAKALDIVKKHNNG